MAWGYGRYPRYVSVAERRQKALKQIAKLNKNGKTTNPIVIEGRTIAKTFWGKAWCTNLEMYSDFENRLPRGRSYVRNGSVMDLQVAPGEITGLVAGSLMYKVNISISKVAVEKWNVIVNDCSGKIDSLIELLQGKFSKAVMEIITNPDKGLFPHPSEIKLNCSCPDWADMCKHVAAVLYGVGACLDNKPEELFLLRQADHIELIAVAGTASITKTKADHSDDVLVDTDLSSLFGIEMSNEEPNTSELKTIVQKNKILTGATKTKKTEKKKSISVATKKPVEKIKMKKVAKVSASKKVKKKITTAVSKVVKKAGKVVKSKKSVVKKTVKRKTKKKRV